MRHLIIELEGIVNAFAKNISSISESDFSAKPNPTKWSKKEVLGHLIDSAENNLRRFICAQYESQPPKIRYDQNFWVTANRYGSAPSNEVIENWKLVNLKICRVLGQMPDQNHVKPCDTGKDAPNLHTIKWLAEDYVKHLKHHLNQIIADSFDTTYP